MQIGGIYSNSIDYGVRQINDAMRKAVDSTIEDMKKEVKVAVSAQVQANADETKKKAIGQFVNIVA